MSIALDSKLFSRRVVGPVYPVQCYFNENGGIDELALQDYVSFLIQNGASTIMTTIGTSRFDVLTHDEIRRFNELVVGVSKGRAVTIVSGPPAASTRVNIDFAMHSQRIGADSYLAVFPERVYSEKDISLFYQDLAECEDIGMLIHEMPIRGGAGEYLPKYDHTMSLLERILSFEHIFGLKEEGQSDDVTRALCDRYAQSHAIIGGKGGMGEFLRANKFGQRSYLVGVGSFFPKVEEEFYRSVIQGKLDKATEIVTKIEKPFFEYAIRNGWHRCLKESLSIVCGMPEWERKPLHNFSLRKRKELESVIASIVDGDSLGLFEK